MATVAMQGLGLVGGVKAQSSTFPMSKVLSCWPSLGRMVEGGQPALWKLQLGLDSPGPSTDKGTLLCFLSRQKARD